MSTKNLGKLAVIYTGQARFLVNNTDQHLRNQGFDLDVYIHYWQPVNNQYTDCGLACDQYHVRTDPNLHNLILEKYHPVKITAEPPINFQNDTKLKIPDNLVHFEKCLPNNVLSMFYSIKAAYQLISSNALAVAAYSFIIRTRLDLYLTEQPQIDWDNLDPDTVYFATINYNGTPNDNWFMVPQKHFGMLELFDLLEHMGSNGVPENLLYKYLMDRHIRYQSLNVKFDIKRL